jgi:hypothetical protein
MRRLVLFLTLAVLLPAAALAQNAPAKKVGIAEAASLIGQTLDADLQYEIGSDAPRATADDWSYGFEYDDAGLMRGASTKERGGEALLATATLYNRRCTRTAVPFSFGSDERFPLKGTVAKGRRADGWLYFGDNASFEKQALKLTMTFSENDGALHFKLDPARTAKAARLAVCATAAAPDAKASRCTLFSLAGFLRAFDFVCDAK